MEDLVFRNLEELKDSGNFAMDFIGEENYESDYDPFEGNTSLDKTFSGKRVVVFDPPDDMIPRAKMSIADVIKENCLPFLPAKTLFRFRAVCKEWNSWIDGPFLAHKQTNYFREFSGLFHLSNDGYHTFISLHEQYYGLPSPLLSFMPKEVYIRSSCNGLVCCQGISNDLYYICNPVNKEWNQLPRPMCYHGPNPAIILAFDPSEIGFGENFKLICALVFPDNPAVHFEIYSSKMNKWRLSDTICCELDAPELKNGGFYMKDVVYWQTLSGKVLAFHLKDEYCGILELPQRWNVSDGILTEVKGELCYILPGKEDNADLLIDIYEIMNMSLKQTISIGMDKLGNGIDRMLPCINGDVLVFLIGNKVMAHDAKSQEVKLLTYMTDDTDGGSYVPYVNSLVSVLPEQPHTTTTAKDLDSSLNNWF